MSRSSSRRRQAARRLPGLAVARATLAALSVAGFGVALAATSAVAAAPASGCGAHASAGSATLTATVGGRRRTVVVHIPAAYAAGARTPLLLSMHGSGASAVDQELFTGMDATADADRFIVAYPQALIADGTGFDWNVPGEPLIGGRPVPAGAPNDVAYLTDLVSYLEGRYCIDAGRVYATGFSGGARMASQLACDAPRIFAAIAAVSGLRRPTPCPASRAAPILAFHGTADRVDPYAGHGQPYWTYSVTQAAADWAHQDGCSAKPTQSNPAGAVMLTTYARCRDGASVELYSISGEGHEWPGGPPLPSALTRLLGPQTNAVDANSLIWAFFRAHPLR